MIVKYCKKIAKKIISTTRSRYNNRSKYTVEGVIKNQKKMLYILSGYKPYLWEDVFERIRLFQTSDMEVCIASSGVYSDKLSDICKKNDWVYISSKLNHVCVLTNIVMREFSKAEYIYKLDEDMYIPQNYFEDMYNAYQKIEQQTDYKMGYICPYIPLGFYAMHDFLIKENCLEEYENQFGKHRIGGTDVNMLFRKQVGIDEYIWSKIGNFDEKARIIKAEGFSYEVCATRPAIPAILFKREFWNEMGELNRSRGIGVGNSGDEGQITSFCALHYLAAFCVKNILVGHFAFGGAEQRVLKFKESRPEIFKLDI